MKNLKEHHLLAGAVVTLYHPGCANFALSPELYKISIKTVWVGKL